MNFDLKVKLLNMLACAEFSGLVVRSGNLASLKKIHQNAFVQDQAADTKHRVLTLCFSASFDHVSHLSMRTERKNPALGLRLTPTVTRSCCVSQLPEVVSIIPTWGVDLL